MLRYLTSYKKTLAWWCCYKKSHEATKIIKIHPSGAMQICFKFNSNLSNYCRDISLKSKKISMKNETTIWVRPSVDAEIFDIIWANFGVLMGLLANSWGHRNDWDFGTVNICTKCHSNTSNHFLDISLNAKDVTKSRPGLTPRASNTDAWHSISYSYNPKSQLHKTPVM